MLKVTIFSLAILLFHKSFAESMSDRDVSFHTTVTHALYCSMDFQGQFKEIENIKPALIGMQEQRILLKYNTELIVTEDLALAKSYLAKTAQQKNLMCRDLDNMMGVMNKQIQKN